MTAQQPVQRDHAMVWQCPLLDGMELMKARYGSLQFARHFHDTFVIELIEEGCDDFVCGSGHHRGQKGDIVVINPHEVHTGSSFGSEPLAYRALYPSRTLLGNLMERDPESSTRLTLASGVIRDSQAASRLASAHRAIETDPDDSRAYRKLVDAIRFFLQRHGQWNGIEDQDGHIPSSLQRARAFLVERSAETVPLEHLADVARMNPYRLNRQFRQRYGLPPHQFQINTRVERARSMLRTGATPVAAAFDCGFADQAHLTRCFRRHVGTTPARYANGKSAHTANAPVH